MLDYKPSNLNKSDTFKCIIVDDEMLARKLLNASLQALPKLEVVAECCNGREAIEVINKQAPDIVFLDIQMPGLGGFDVIRLINPKKMPEIIFVTAYDAFAIDAFDANAVDYILKPISDERLSRAVSRAIFNLSQGETDNPRKKDLYSAVKKIADRVRVKSHENIESRTTTNETVEEERKLSIKDNDTVSLVKEADIDWIDAAGDYMCIHVSGETYVMRSTMYELLERLDTERFKRVHRSTIVNTDRIIKIQKHTKGEYILHLSCDEKIKVSRHYKSVIRDFIDNQP